MFEQGRADEKAQSRAHSTNTRTNTKKWWTLIMGKVTECCPVLGAVDGRACHLQSAAVMRSESRQHLEHLPSYLRALSSPDNLFFVLFFVLFPIAFSSSLPFSFPFSFSFAGRKRIRFPYTRCIARLRVLNSPYVFGLTLWSHHIHTHTHKKLNKI